MMDVYEPLAKLAVSSRKIEPTDHAVRAVVRDAFCTCLRITFILVDQYLSDRALDVPAI